MAKKEELQNVAATEKLKALQAAMDKIEEILLVEEDKNLIILAIVELCKLNIRDFFGCISEFFKRNVKNI